MVVAAVAEQPAERHIDHPAGEGQRASLLVSEDVAGGRVDRSVPLNGARRDLDGEQLVLAGLHEADGVEDTGGRVDDRSGEDAGGIDVAARQLAVGDGGRRVGRA